MTDILNRAADNLWSEGWDEEAAAVREAASRIEKLEAVLRKIAYGPHEVDDTYFQLFERGKAKARKALEGKYD